MSKIKWLPASFSLYPRLTVQAKCTEEKEKSEEYKHQNSELQSELENIRKQLTDALEQIESLRAQAASQG